jgi:hypothetical protein
MYNAQGLKKDILHPKYTIKAISLLLVDMLLVVCNKFYVTNSAWVRG